MTTPPAEPGERPPAGRLDRPPSDRYSRDSATSAPGASISAPEPAARVLGPAMVAGLITAALLVVVGGVLAIHVGLVAISGLGGGAIGLLVARGAAPPDGATPARWSRREATRVAAGLALATVLVAAAGIWVLSRVEGGVMDPLSYLWETTGALVLVLAVIAMLTAVWGAGAGPIRWRA